MINGVKRLCQNPQIYTTSNTELSPSLLFSDETPFEDTYTFSATLFDFATLDGEAGGVLNKSISPFKSSTNNVDRTLRNVSLTENPCFGPDNPVCFLFTTPFSGDPPLRAVFESNPVMLF